MAVARHPLPKELVGVPIEAIMDRYVRRFHDRKPDWAAFEDAKIEGFKRAQHRFIGAGGSGKHADSTVIPAGNFTLSIMYVEPGQGNAAHTHEVEEIFFVLQGFLDVFVEDEAGKRQERNAAVEDAGVAQLVEDHASGEEPKQPTPGAKYLEKPTPFFELVEHVEM